MSKKLVTSYTFDASAQTIVAADFTSLEKIQLITNVTDNIVIYNFADATKGGALSGTTLTLDYDTTTMDDTDKLQIFVEDATQAVPVTDNGGTLTVDGTVSVTDGLDIEGTIASGATDSGKPVKTGGVQNTTQPTLTDGQRGDVQLDTRANTKVSLWTPNGATGQNYTADNADAAAVSATASKLAAVNRNTVYNGTTWDRQRGDATDGTLVNLGSNNDVTLGAALPAGNNNIGDVDVASSALPTGASTAAKQLADNHNVVVTSAPAVTGSVTATSAGDVAHDAVDSGNPVKVGGKAATGITTPVADADRTNAWLDEYGRQVVSDKDTELGLTSGTTGLRDKLVAQRYTVLSDSLANGINAFWTQTAANGGTASSTVGEGQLKTSTATNGSMILQSTTVVYYPGQVNWLNSAMRFGDTGVAGNIRRLGMFTVSGTTPQEGFYFELNGTTLNAVTVKGGSATAVAQSSWTRNGVAPFTLDANYHSLEIRYTANTVWFYIDNVLRHQVSGASTALTTTLDFPITLQNTKTSGATDITLAVRNIGNGRFGMPGGVVAETGLSAVEALAVGGGTPHDSVDAGNPLKMGGRAQATAPTSVGAGDRVNTWHTLSGAVNIGASGTNVATGSGNATGAMRVELPTNGTGVIATVGAVTAITNALPAGTNAIGKLSANSGVDIGDVDVTSLPALPAGNNNIGDVDVATLPVAFNTGTRSATTQRVTIATDDSVPVTNAGLTALNGAVAGTEVQVDVVGALPAGNNNIGDVDVASSALPTGASTSANQSTIIGHVDGIETVLGTIDADTGTIAGAVAGTEMQVDVVGALPAGNNNIGDVDVASSALPTGASTSANQSTIIGHLDGVETALGLLATDATLVGAIKTEDAAHSSGDKGIMPLAVRNDTATPLAGTTGDYIPLSTDANGALWTTQATLSAGEDLSADIQKVLFKPVVSSAYAPSTYQQAGSVTAANIKASAGNVYYIRITNAAANVRWFQLHNKATIPLSTEAAQVYFVVPAGNSASPGVLELNIMDFAPSEYFSTGIGWAISTAAATYTAATAGNHECTIRYV